LVRKLDPRRRPDFSFFERQGLFLRMNGRFVRSRRSFHNRPLRESLDRRIRKPRPDEHAS
jgi:hypothetical protein